MAEKFTLMAVHAHPDDEAIGTGGIFARYAEEGIRTVLVTCTDGALGDSPGGLKPDQDGHDPDEVVRVRMEELRSACAHLGVEHLELLGYADSGMMGWPQNDAEGSFWSTPIEEAAAKLATLMERYRPQVVVTYDGNGFYGHPDHIQAHRITMAAAENTGIPRKIYFTAIPKSAIRELFQRMRELNVDGPGEDVVPPDADEPPFGTPDELISAVIDVSPYAERKWAALGAHSSQISENSFFLALPEEIRKRMFAQEAFIREYDTTGAALPEDDLFAGLR